MQIVSTGDNLHEMSKSIYWDIKKMSSAEFAQKVVKVNSALVLL